MSQAREVRLWLIFKIIQMGDVFTPVVDYVILCVKKNLVGNCNNLFFIIRNPTVLSKTLIKEIQTKGNTIYKFSLEEYNVNRLLKKFYSELSPLFSMGCESTLPLICHYKICQQDCYLALWEPQIMPCTRPYLYIVYWTILKLIDL